MVKDPVIDDFTRGKLNIMVAVVIESPDYNDVGELILLKLDKKMIVPENVAVCNGTHVYSLNTNTLTILGDL